MKRKREDFTFPLMFSYFLCQLLVYQTARQSVNSLKANSSSSCNVSSFSSTVSSIFRLDRFAGALNRAKNKSLG